MFISFHNINHETPVICPETPTQINIFLNNMLLCFQIRQDLTQHWFTPRITWNDGEFIRAEVVSSSVKNIPKKYDKKPHTISPRNSTGTPTDATRGAIPKLSRAPIDKKEQPNYYCRILHLEGTQNNNKKATALNQFCMETFNKQLTGVSSQ